MVKIFYVIKGELIDSSFKIVNVNEQVKSHFPKYSKFRFALLQDNIYSTKTLVKELIKDRQDTLILTPITDEEVANKYNQLKRELDSVLIEQNGQIQQNKKQNQTDIKKQDKQNQNQENRQQKPYQDNHYHCLNKCSTNNSPQQRENLIQSSHSSSFSDLLNSQSKQSYNEQIQEEDQDPLSNQLFKAGYLQQYMQQEEQIQEQSCISINKMEYSDLLTVEFKCMFCNLGLNGNFISTNCLHYFHEECLLQSIKTQFNNNPSISQFTCICQKQISIQILKLFKDQQYSQMLKQQILHNQLNQIQSLKQYQYIKCSREYCEFFYITTNNDKTNSSFCPGCLEIIQNK